MKLALLGILALLAGLSVAGCAKDQANWKLIHDYDEFYSWTCYVDQNKPVMLKRGPPFNQSNSYDGVCFRYLKAAVKP